MYPILRKITCYCCCYGGCHGIHGCQASLILLKFYVCHNIQTWPEYVDGKTYQYIQGWIALYIYFDLELSLLNIFASWMNHFTVTMVSNIHSSQSYAQQLFSWHQIIMGYVILLIKYIFWLRNSFYFRLHATSGMMHVFIDGFTL